MLNGTKESWAGSEQAPPPLGPQRPPGGGEVAWLELTEAWGPRWPQLLADSAGLTDDLGLRLDTDPGAGTDIAALGVAVSGGGVTGLDAGAGS